MSRPALTCPYCFDEIEATAAATAVASRRCPRCNIRVEFGLADTTIAAYVPEPPPSGVRLGSLVPLAVLLLGALGVSLLSTHVPAGSFAAISLARPSAAATSRLPAIPPDLVRPAPRQELAALDGIALGEALFRKEWLPHQPLNPGSDGLGPVYNERSCVACHYQGGVGGGGPVAQNVDILSTGERAGARGRTSEVLARFGVDPAYAARRERRIGRDEPGDTTVVPVAVTFDPSTCGCDQVRTQVTCRLLSSPRARAARLDLTLVRTQRNPTALFGLGLLDAIPDEAIEAAARRRDLKNPEIAGRIGRREDGRIGRYGWRAQMATLGDFVRQACALEIGLEVPGHHQAKPPEGRAAASPTGLDMTEKQCAALIAYVRSLPAPELRHSPPAEQGERTFAAIGCGSCHMSSLGPVRGLYSDLLLHDMGPGLVDNGSYDLEPRAPRAPAVELARDDPGLWRTAPLWGVADSAPYLHDGRALDLVEAIALHGGEAEKAARRFFELAPAARAEVLSFLGALRAPADAD
jgi:CxxC motif-containing protein (DUF1111 family)